jgi:hypothetical protein
MNPPTELLLLCAPAAVHVMLLLATAVVVGV